MSKAEDAQGAALLAVQQASEAGPGCMLCKLACVPRRLQREREPAPAHALCILCHADEEHHVSNGPPHATCSALPLLPEPVWMRQD